MEKVGNDLRRQGEGVANDRYLRHGNIVAVPMVGIMGTTDPRVEATRNAKVLAGVLGGTSLPLSGCAFIDQHASDVHDPALEEWDRTDIAIYTCEAIKQHFGGKALAPMPTRLYQQMKDQAKGEVGGLFLKEEGKEIVPRDFKRIGMSYGQLQRVARSGRAILIAGVQERRIEPALCCLRGRLVSTLITNPDFAWKILEIELGVQRAVRER
ncbi:MAG TPA: hypothetical protein VMM92_04360, partial [Thermoanaerobaculia bacterium]|nr:hypothetical protein [Thermoanaerobaculia bacterium]